jgi:hypothetical protein
VLEPVADDKATLAVSLVAGLQRHDRLAIAMRRVAADDVFFDLLRVEHVLIRRLVDRLAGILVQLGFDIEASTWLTPPQRKIQITDFALGVKWGWPVGGCHAALS